jgi:hypothetical protein
MKKLFTLVAFMACFLGAKAEWVEDYNIDYSTKSAFPFYVMGYVPEWYDGIMTDFGALYKYVKVTEDATETSDVIVKTEDGTEYYKIVLSEPAWHQYFIADGIPTEIDGSYTVKALVKASEDCTINVNMGWGWGDGQQAGASVKIPASSEFQEVEWTYSGIAGTSCNLVAQPGTCQATIEWKSLTVSHNEKPKKPTVWQEWLTKDGQPVVVDTKPSDIPTYMGNAETPWADPNVRFDDQTQNNLICAWGKEHGRNVNEDGGSDPFPCDIEDDGTGNHVFVVHAKDCGDPTADASAWDNQFWIESPRSWKEGEQLKIHFRYKASQAAKTNTQVHHQNPSNYQHWQAIGDINFTTEWQEFDKVVAWPNGAGDDAWSIAFNLNPEVKTATDFYFDDLSWQSMVLEEGYFVAGANAKEGIEYDLDNAIQFEYTTDDGCYTAVVGEAGAYINQVMISTVRGNDAAFKSNTLKPSGIIKSDPDEWLDYTAASLAKLNLPGTGIWKIYLDDAYKAMAFEMLEGTLEEPLEITPNPTEIVIHGKERDWRGLDNDGNQIEEGGVGTGQPWDNQFFIKAERKLASGEATVLSFKYRSTVSAKTTTQCHGEPGAYLHWGAIGDVNFEPGDWQEFSKDFTVPGEANDMQCIAFNMAEIKEACDYYITDVVWALKDGSETLINMKDGRNFWIKEGAGTTPYQMEVPEDDPTGINNVVNKATRSAVIYNIAGQRVSKDYKGLVIKDGKKAVVK